MTPDEAVKECIDYLEKFKNNITEGVGREKTLTYAHKQLKTAISLIQDYQKLREKIDVDKMMPIIRSSRRETETMIGDYFPDRIAQSIVTYLQQPTEH